MHRLLLVGALLCLANVGWCQPPSEPDGPEIRARLAELRSVIAELKQNQDDVRSVADVEVFAKAADWILRHHEFYKSEYQRWTLDALAVGQSRATEMLKSRQAGSTTLSWLGRPGGTVLGYYSDVDGSVQPVAIRIPKSYDPKGPRRWPLHVELHGRGATLNEVSFIHSHEGKPAADTEYLQLDVFGRTNNAYRWAGEKDVFEAISLIQRHFRIDDQRVTLRGFSMGGAGAWHLGLHYPSLWSSVGAGAGFCDTMHHLSLKEPLSPLHQKLTRIYDAQDYALNAFNVPIIGYGGELDPQVFASTRMHELGEKLGVPIPQLIGPQTKHQFHPESLKEFMAFHARHTVEGRPRYPAPSRIRFITYTLKYNTTDWIVVEEQVKPYEASTIDAEVDATSDTVRITTENVAVLQVMRDVAAQVQIDGGKPLPLQTAADGLLPGVYYEKREDGWVAWDYNLSHKYAAHELDGGEPRKRHRLQGPIDDAFMAPFLCVRPTGTPWNPSHNEWAKWTLSRFESEFDKWMRGQVPVINDTQVTEELIESRHLILFGDPGSNAVLAKVLPKLPIDWNRTALSVNGQTYDPASHGVALIYPNPLNPNRYVVLNSGHTFHEPEFRASNANLYPRLGDIAVIQFAPRDSGYSETVRFAEIFNARWKLGD